MKVLVSGASGFIGSHLLKHLAAVGYEVTAIASPRGIPATAIRGASIHWLCGDMCDLEFVSLAVRDHDAMIHLCGLYPLFGEAPRPLEYFQANTVSTAVSLEACRRAGGVRFILSSTAQVYGKPVRLPIVETDPLNGATLYAATKASAEAMARGYYATYHLPTLSLRIFNVYGPRQPSSNVIGTVTEQALRRDKVTIHDAAPERDFVYVEDVVHALRAAISCPDPRGQAINVGSGEAVSIGDVARHIMRIAGRRDHVESRTTANAATEDGRDCIVADISLARQLLPWQPRFSLDQGLRATFEWTRESPAPTHLPHSPCTR